MRHPQRLRLIVVVLCACSALLVACSRAERHERQERAERAERAERDDTSASARVGYGTAMGDVARRFELLGRAAIAGRFELADYELGEISEIFEEVLPHAALPKEGHPEVLPALVSAFLQKQVPELQRALTTRDRAQAAAAFARTATACNGCHQASGHGFIEVPLVAGHGVPNTDPVSP
jgi:hypothetical protein